MRRGVNIMGALARSAPRAAQQVAAHEMVMPAQQYVGAVFREHTSSIMERVEPLHEEREYQGSENHSGNKDSAWQEYFKQFKEQLERDLNKTLGEAIWDLPKTVAKEVVKSQIEELIKDKLQEMTADTIKKAVLVAPALANSLREMVAQATSSEARIASLISLSSAGTSYVHFDKQDDASKLADKVIQKAVEKVMQRNDAAAGKINADSLMRERPAMPEQKAVERSEQGVRRKM
jgi:hypothetical protein